MKTIRLDNLSKVGFINRTHGYKGTVHCITDLAKPEKLLKVDFLFLLINGLPVPFLIEEMEVNETDFYVKLEDINSDGEGKKLLQTEIYAETVKEKKKSAFLSWRDLKGYMAIDETYGELNTIEEVNEFPMQFIAKCTINNKEVLFPLNDEIVTEIDEDKKIIYLDLPIGLVEMYLD